MLTRRTLSWLPLLHPTRSVLETHKAYNSILPIVWPCGKQIHRLHCPLRAGGNKILSGMLQIRYVVHWLVYIYVYTWYTLFRRIFLLNIHSRFADFTFEENMKVRRKRGKMGELINACSDDFLKCMKTYFEELWRRVVFAQKKLYLIGNLAGG